MGLKELFIKKAKPILNDEDNRELREIQRVNYMNEARKIMELRGVELARKELALKKEEKNGW